MEFKISEKSKESLQKIFDEENKIKEEQDKLFCKSLEKNNFRNKEEIVEYLKSGKKIISVYSSFIIDSDCSFKYIPDSDEVEQHFLEFNEYDIPIGFATKRESFDSWLIWLTECVDIEENKKNGFIVYFERG